MAKRTSVDNLPAAIAEILDEYGEEVSKNANEITERVAKKGVQALKSASSVFKGTKYRNGWKVDFERWPYSGIKAHIWNAKVPGLPHLLENGHLLRNGERSTGRVHIKPVEETLVREYIAQMEKKL